MKLATRNLLGSAAAVDQAMPSAVIITIRARLSPISARFRAVLWICIFRFLGEVVIGIGLTSGQYFLRS